MTAFDFQKTDAVSYLKSLPKNSCRLILTDPPYGISKKTGFKSYTKGKGVDRLAISMDFGKWDRLPEDKLNALLDEVIKESYRVLKSGGTLIIFYDLWKISDLKRLLEKHKFKQLRFIEWIKTNPVPINQSINYLTNAREVAITATKGGKPYFNAKYHSGVFNLPIHRDGGKRLHPTQKPLALMKELISIHCDSNEIVVDPFAGSGTTLLAAKQTGRKYRGCEVNYNYFRKAQKRLNDG